MQSDIQASVEVIQSFISKTLDKYAVYLVSEGIDEKVVEAVKAKVLLMEKITKKSPKKEIDDEHRCSWISERSKNADKRCAKKTVDNTPYCRAHMKMMEKREQKEANRCAHIMRTGNQCKSYAVADGFCKKHQSEKEVSPPAKKTLKTEEKVSPAKKTLKKTEKVAPLFPMSHDKICELVDKALPELKLRLNKKLSIIEVGNIINLCEQVSAELGNDEEIKNGAKPELDWFHETTHELLKAHHPVCEICEEFDWIGFVPYALNGEDWSEDDDTEAE